MALRDIMKTLEKLAPLRCSESWDNVGLLAGDPDDIVTKALLTIDMTHAVFNEARTLECQLIIAYHPPIFDGLKRIDAKSPVGLALRHGIAIYSPHTALDAATGGTNDVLAEAVGLSVTVPIKPLRSLVPSISAQNQQARDLGENLGMGRIGSISPLPRLEFIAQVKKNLGLDHVLVAGPTQGSLTKVAVAAGAAGDLLKLAMSQGADALVCGEVRHHDALAAAAGGMTVICARHSCSERQALTPLRDRLAAQHPSVAFRLSEKDRDPFSFL